MVQTSQNLNPSNSLSGPSVDISVKGILRRDVTQKRLEFDGGDRQPNSNVARHANVLGFPAPDR